MGKNEKVVSVEELRGSREEWLDSIIDDSPISPYKSSQRIRKVPQMLRETKDFQMDYAPRVVSIGPYHYRDKKLQEMNKLKRKIASKFVTNDKQQLKDLYGELFKVVKYLRSCYDDDQNSSSTDDDDHHHHHIPDDEEFTRMMLLDGCFILYYISYVGKGNDHEVLGMQTHHIAFVQHDLFLLENQLPFDVLELLLNKSMLLTKDAWVNNMREFILRNIMVPPRPSNKKNTQPQVMVPPRPAHLLEILHRTIVGTGRPEDCQNNWYTFRNVKELREVGIRLKPAQTSCLTGIKYARRGIFGRLELPPITVDDATKAKFLNLIAYETCPDAYNQELWVTSYVCFLDSLIDHADDVKELRSAQILHNHLGSDDDVAKLFNEIGTDLVPQPCAYSKVKSSIQSHYNSKGLNYMAQFKHQHLKNPWTILALFAGFVILFFSGVQTYFQVWSSPSDCDQLCKHIRIREHI